MRVALFALLLLTGCASENLPIADGQPGPQDETECRHRTLGELETAYQQCRQKAIESRREEAKALALRAQEAKNREAANQEATPDNGEATEKPESFGDRLRSTAAAIFNIGR
jgi:predicted phage gp36 major capsid-like protein